MIADSCRLPVLALLVVGLSACSQNEEKWRSEIEKELARMDAMGDPTQAYLDHMINNAVLHDMSVADIHFIAHSSEISGVGELRLNRLAPLLATYGGTVRYETSLTDRPLVDNRLSNVREYLTLAGCDMDRVELKLGLPGGRGMPGDEAVEKHEQGTANPSSSGGATTTLPGLMSPSQGG